MSNAQVPQGFNYQAIARDETGQPIVNTAIPVQLSIQSDSLGGTVFWKELHSSVTTNDLGLFTLVVGKGARQSGTASTFDEIDWTVAPQFIMIEVDYGGWKTMGSSRLWAVPYSMVAKDLSGAVNKLTVEGATSDMEESLFEVKNKLGQTVFAVYNEGVRIYVDDGDAKGLKGGFAIGGLNPAKDAPQDLFIVSPDSIRAYIYDDPLVKGLKGGFAIGGFNTAKGLTNDYLLISPDSIRAYIDTDPAKAIKGGFAIGSINPAKAGSEEYLRVTRDSTRVYINDIPGKAIKGGFAIGGINTAKGAAKFFDVTTEAATIINPSQNRILWYPLKNAFLTGRVLIDNPANVGENSFATGYESKAKGMYSQAMGYKAAANGNYSTAIGKYATANSINSFAFGESANAINPESYAIGRGAVANGYRSFSFGSAGVDSAGIATDVTRALGDYSFAIGQGSKSVGKGSFAIGIANTANGNFSVATGYKTSANIGSTSMGYNTMAGGGYSTALGIYTTASGQFSTALGYGAIASGDNSTALGAYTVAPSLGETAIGTCNTLYTAYGVYTWYNWDRLFVIGNGETTSERSDALVVLKTGDVGIGISYPSARLHVIGNGSGGVGIGSYVSGSTTNVTSIWGESTGTGAGDSKAIVAKANRNGPGRHYTGYFYSGGTQGSYHGLYADLRTGGGIDLAEYIYDTVGNTEQADVVVADSENKESIVKSTKPYETSVIGVVSSNPHMVIGTELLFDDESGEYYENVNAAKLAIAGRVPVKATDENGPILIGDCVTTSSIPGYAMKWTLLDLNEATDFDELKSILAENEKRRSAIIGKALESLESGEDEIMVLVGIY